VLDVIASGLRDPQPVQREQRDQRMFRRRAKPGVGVYQSLMSHFVTVCLQEPAPGVPPGGPGTRISHEPSD
jgi:hypothetical protein